jgi:hypothetical protein
VNAGGLGCILFQTLHFDFVLDVSLEVGLHGVMYDNGLRVEIDLDHTSGYLFFGVGLQCRILIVFMVIYRDLATVINHSFIIYGTHQYCYIGRCPRLPKD